MSTPYRDSAHPYALIITRDNALSKDLEQKLLELRSFDAIDIIPDCVDGVACARKKSPDLIIFDTEVSVLEVLNALRAVKAISHHIQCVVIADHIGYHALLSMVGADNVLYKGFSQTELACCLN